MIFSAIKRLKTIFEPNPPEATNYHLHLSGARLASKVAASSVVGFKAPDDSGRCDPHAAVPYFYLDLLELCRGLGHGALAGF